MMLKRFNQVAQALLSKLGLPVVRYVFGCFSSITRADNVPSDIPPGVANRESFGRKAFAGERTKSVPRDTIVRKEGQQVQGSFRVEGELGRTGNFKLRQHGTCKSNTETTSKLEAIAKEEKVLGNVQRLVQQFEELSRNATPDGREPKSPSVGDLMVASRHVDVAGRTSNFGVVGLGPLPTAATDRPRKVPLTWKQKYDRHLYRLQVAERLARAAKAELIA